MLLLFINVVLLNALICLSGDLTSRLTSDTSTMSDALSLNTNIFLRSLIKAS